MQKIVNGVLVDLTQAEIDQRNADALIAQEEQAKQDVIDAIKITKATGKEYLLNGVGFMIPFRSVDALGILQVKTAFELGVTSTNISFSNGVKMPIDSADFGAFASWFATERNKYFI